MRYMKNDILGINKALKIPGPRHTPTNSVTNKDISYSRETQSDDKDALPGYDTLPVYEVEFIPIERREYVRCSPFQRLMSEPTTFSERRALSGRRATDFT